MLHAHPAPELLDGLGAVWRLDARVSTAASSAWRARPIPAPAPVDDLDPLRALCAAAWAAADGGADQPWRYRADEPSRPTPLTVLGLR